MPAQMMNQPLTITKIIQEAPHIRTFWFSLGQPMAFRPGQFFMISADIGGEKVKRAYSCANPPTFTDHIEFTLDLVPSGKMSTFMFSRKEGDQLIVQGPYGKFFFDEATQHAVFIGGGTGCAPLRAMLLYAIAKNSPIPMTYIASAKLPDDLIYRN